MKKLSLLLMSFVAGVCITSAVSGKNDEIKLSSMLTHKLSAPGIRL